VRGQSETVRERGAEAVRRDEHGGELSGGKGENGERVKGNAGGGYQ